MRWFSALGSSITVTLLTVALAWPAYAVAWGTLTVNEGGKQQGRGYGNYYNHNQTHARNGASYIDSRPGGDGIYVETHHQFYYADCSTGNCSAQFNETGSDQSPRSNGSGWAYDDAYQVLRPQSTQARGVIKVCEDQSLSGDPCSFNALPTFSY